MYSYSGSKLRALTLLSGIVPIRHHTPPRALLPHPLHPPSPSAQPTPHPGLILHILLRRQHKERPPGTRSLPLKDPAHLVNQHPLVYHVRAEGQQLRTRVAQVVEERALREVLRGSHLHLPHRDVARATGLAREVRGERAGDAVLDGVVCGRGDHLGLDELGVRAHAPCALADGDRVEVVVREHVRDHARTENVSEELGELVSRIADAVGVQEDAEECDEVVREADVAARCLGAAWCAR